MRFTDFSDFCRLCLMPLDGPHLDCAIDDNVELKDTIKMVYNIDIKRNDEYSTKVCLMCCDILLCNTIHYVRAMEAQNSLTRIQRIKNKIRNFGKKKITDRKEQKQQQQQQQQQAPADTSMIVDVEMIEIEPNSMKTSVMECCENDETTEDSHFVSINASSVALRTESNQQRLFGDLTSFNQQQNQNPWSATVGYEIDKYSEDDNFDMTDYLIVPPLKIDIDQNNNTKQTPSFFQLAKRFCDSMRNSVDRGIDEITKQLALLRFAPC